MEIAMYAIASRTGCPRRAESEQGARAGCIQSMLDLAASLRRPEDGPVDPAAAEAWLRFAFAKAVVFRDEDRVGAIQVAIAELALARDDVAEARAFLESAAEAGEPTAMRRLADLVGEDELELDLALFLRGRARQVERRVN
jgi:hypothetical protein